MRSRTLSKFIFASCVGYFDRAYYVRTGFEGNKIWQNLTTSDKIWHLTTSDKIRQNLTAAAELRGGVDIQYSVYSLYKSMYMKCVYEYSKAEVYFSQHLFIPMFWDIINEWCGYDEENRANKLATKKKTNVFLCFPSLRNSSVAALACAPSHQAITKCEDCQGMAPHHQR